MTNKSSSGGGDNKIHQIVMAVITTIAAPLIVFFVTNNIKNSSSQTPTPIVQVVTATPEAGEPTAVAGTTAVAPATTVVPATAVAGATVVAQATTTATNPPAPTEKPAEAGNNRPGGIIPAGTSVQVDGLQMTVYKEDVKMDGKNIRVTVRVKNTTTETRTLAFTPAAVSLKDDKAHIYSPIYGAKKSECKKEELGKTHTLELKPQAQVNLTSVSLEKAADWCSANPGSAIPLFSGPVEKGAKKLILQINGVGPFQGFQVEIPL